MIIFPMLLRSSEHCSSGTDWLTCKLGLTQHLTRPGAAQLHQHLPTEILPDIAPQTFPTLYQFPTKSKPSLESHLKNGDYLSLHVRWDKVMIPTLPDSGHRIWGDGGRGRWGLMKRESSILNADLFPLLPLLRPLNFKLADVWLCLSDRWHKTPRKWWYELKICPICFWNEMWPPVKVMPW